MGIVTDTPASEKRRSGLRLSLPAKSENVALVRHALAGLAEESGIGEAALADLKIVVTEACMNVVLHAYPAEPGPLSVEAELDEAGMTVVVRDEGVGIHPRLDSERESLHLGLPLIAALSSDFAISRGDGGRGTQLSIRLAPVR